MSKQLAVSSAIAIMMMAIFALYAPSAADHIGALPQNAAHWPQLAGFKALIAN